MANCDLTRSKGKICKDVLGGNSIIYLYDDLADPFTLTASSATAMNVALDANFSYALEGDGNTFEQVGDSAINQVVTMTLTVTLRTMSALDAAEFNLLAKSRAQVVIKDRGDNYMVMGITEGCSWNITASTGGAKGDANGYTLVATCQEADYAPFLDESTTTAFLAVTTAV